MTGRILYSYGDTKQLFGILHFVGVLHLISGFSSIHLLLLLSLVSVSFVTLPQVLNI